MKNSFTLGETVTALGDLFLPRLCAVCGDPLGVRERHVCIRCAADLPLTHYWERSHNPMADRFNALLQRQLFPGPAGGGTAVLADPPAPYGPAEPYAYAASLLLYHADAGYKRIPQRVKYGADLRAGVFFGRMLGECLVRSPALHDVETVIPVPLHWTRRWQRGYNQAELIGAAVADTLGAVLRSDILVRERRTRTQTRLHGADKQRNVAGAFTVRPRAQEALRREVFRHVLLVDDVFTTGATLSACFHALRRVIPPPVRISIATLACVDG